MDRLTVVDGIVELIVVVYVVAVPDKVVVTVDKLTVVEGIVEEIVVVYVVNAPESEVVTVEVATSVVVDDAVEVNVTD